MALSTLLGGPETVNLVATFAVVVVLFIVSRVANVLDGRGTLAAAGIGLVVGVFGHVTWLLVLLGFLGLGQLATRWSWDAKTHRGFAEQHGGARGWLNVVANGGLPTLVALMAWVDQDWRLWFPVFSASVAVAAADTLASELGCLDPRVRLILIRISCPPGTNGGVSPTGQWAALLGASIVAVAAWAIGWAARGGSVDGALPLIVFVTLIGWLGCQVDSVLGMGLENRGLIGKHTVNALAIGLGIGAAWSLFLMLGWSS